MTPDGSLECAAGTCRAAPARPYPEGPRCDPHSPWARAGLPPPGTGRYCLDVCYCHGGQCAGRRDVPLPAITDTIVDFRVIAAGKRRPRSLNQYREAQDAVRRR